MTITAKEAPVGARIRWTDDSGKPREGVVIDVSVQPGSVTIGARCVMETITTEVPNWISPERSVEIIEPTLPTYGGEG